MSRWLIASSKKDLFYKELRTALESNDLNSIYNLIKNEKLTMEDFSDTEDGEILGKAVVKILDERPIDCFKDKIFTKEDKKLFNAAMDHVTDSTNDCYALLENNILTREDGDLFYKALNQVQDYNPSRKILDLLQNNIITLEDINKATYISLSDEPDRVKAQKILNERKEHYKQLLKEYENE